MINKKNAWFFLATLVVLSACATKSIDEARTKYLVAIIGSGAAGLTAGIYTQRAKLETLIIEGPEPMGLLSTSPVIENWPGEKSISGYDLMSKIHDHAKSTGCSFLQDSVVGVDFSQRPYKLTTGEGKTYEAHSVIIAMGVKRKKLGCPGEEEYWHKGVSACATCDAPFYKDKTVVVVGGGNTALIEAAHISHYAKKVYIVHTSGVIRSIDPIKDVVMRSPKIEIIHNIHVKEIVGDGNRVTGIVLEAKEDKSLQTIKTDGVFVAIGFEPNTKMLDGQIALDKHGYIATIDGSKTSKDGIFVAGDIAHAKYKQAIVAAGDGCRAALDAIAYLDVRLGLDLV